MHSSALALLFLMLTVAAPVHAATLTVQWDDSNAGAAQTQIYRRSGTGASSRITTVAPTVTSYADSGLRLDRQYCYKLRALVGTTLSTYTPEVCATPSSTPPPPPPPPPPPVTVCAGVCSLFASTLTPAFVGSPEPTPVELGVKFSSDVAGYVTGVRFYRAASQANPFQVSLWSATGTRIATTTAMVPTTTDGWVSIAFPTPVPILAKAVYTASYWASNGNFSGTRSFFTADFVNGALHAPAAGNGPFTYAGPNVFPADTWMNSNYFVDVLFTTTPGATTPANINHALALNGGVATASSTIIASWGTYPVASVIDGERTGKLWERDGGWNDATADVWPDWVEVQLAGPRTLTSINVFTTQDGDITLGREVTAATLASQNGIEDFRVEYWSAGAWAILADVVGNDRAWRHFDFPVPTVTDRIRVFITKGRTSYSRLTEIEAIGN